MGNKLKKKIDIKNCIYFFFNGLIIIKILNPNKFKIDER